jgi:hypothetical protein
VTAFALLLVVVGLLMNIVGALMFTWGDLRQMQAMLRYFAKDRSQFKRDIGRLPRWRRVTLSVGAKVAPRDIMAMNQEELLSAFPRQAVGFLVMVLGSVLQMIGSLLTLSTVC